MDSFYGKNHSQQSDSVRVVSRIKSYCEIYAESVVFIAIFVSIPFHFICKTQYAMQNVDWN